MFAVLSKRGPKPSSVYICSSCIRNFSSGIDTISSSAPVASSTGTIEKDAATGSGEGATPTTGSKSSWKINKPTPRGTLGKQSNGQASEPKPQKRMIDRRKDRLASLKAARPDASFKLLLKLYRTELEKEQHSNPGGTQDRDTLAALRQQMLDEGNGDDIKLGAMEDGAPISPITGVEKKKKKKKKKVVTASASKQTTKDETETADTRSLANLGAKQGSLKSKKSPQTKNDNVIIGQDGSSKTSQGQTKSKKSVKKGVAAKASEQLASQTAKASKTTTSPKVRRVDSKSKSLTMPTSASSIDNNNRASSQKGQAHVNGIFQSTKDSEEQQFTIRKLLSHGPLGGKSHAASEIASRMGAGNALQHAALLDMLNVSDMSKSDIETAIPLVRNLLQKFNEAKAGKETHSFEETPVFQSLRQAMQGTSALASALPTKDIAASKAEMIATSTITQKVDVSYRGATPREIKTIAASELALTPVDTGPLEVPKLSYGLERVLFNPGVYQLQDPRSKVFNFDPYLQEIMPVSEFDFTALKAYITSSKDKRLMGMAKQTKTKYTGSTSSMTSALGHFHFLLSHWRPINPGILSRDFPVEFESFTQLQRGPTAIFLRHSDGVYAIDADKEFDTANILSSLGKSMEKLLTLPTNDFERYRKPNSSQISEEERNEEEAFHYTTMGDFLMRSQLDAHDPRLPGTGMFDLKTRAVVAIRMDTSQYEVGSGYEIRSRFGEWESYEREYYDMIRSAFLKYSLQVRMGRMDGIFVAFHNTERVFGFQYISLPEMDNALHGSYDTAIGDSEFKLSVDLLNRVLDRATTKYPGKSLRMFFETRPATTPFMYIFVEPVEEKDIEKIQTSNKSEIEEFEARVLGLSHEEEQQRQAEWEDLHSNVEQEMDLDEDRVERTPFADYSEESSTRKELQDFVNAAAQEDGEAEDDDDGDLEELEDEESDEEEEEAEENDEEEDDDEDDEIEEEENGDADEKEDFDVVSNRETAPQDVETLVNERDQFPQDVAHELLNQKHDESAKVSVGETHEASNLSGINDTTHESTTQQTDVNDTLAQNSMLSENEHISDASNTEFASPSDDFNTDTTSYTSIGQFDEEYHDAHGHVKPATVHEAEENAQKGGEAESQQGPDAISEKEEPESEVFAMTLMIRNKVNGRYVTRPQNLSSSDDWQVEYSIAEVDDMDRARNLYESSKARRSKVLNRTRKEGKWNSQYSEKLMTMAKKSREWRKRVEEKEKMTPKKILVVEGKEEQEE